MAKKSVRQPVRSKSKLPMPLPVLALIALVLASAAYSVVSPSTAQAADHPTPREGVTAANVLPPQQFASDPGIAEVYANAAKIPGVLDGIYCYCNCKEQHGHVSLLTCFESEHGSQCGVCMGEATMAYNMTQQGKSLEEIRAAVDKQFGGV